MSWLSNVVRPKLQQLVGVRREIPEDLWQKCPKCEQMIFHRELEKNLRVCPHCQHHLRLKVKERLAMLFDDGRYELIPLPAVTADPLKFRDLRRYPDRLKEAQAKTGQSEALLVARGTIGGHAVVVAALDFEFLGGSMGIAVGDGLLIAARAAIADRLPLIAIPASGGARMQEGILSLMQMARTTVAVQEVKAAGLPYLVILTDPTTGGVSASFAMLGDIAIAETGAVIGFAGARVIEQTIRESLPDGFQTAEYLYEHGMVDLVVRRHELKATLARVLVLLLKPVLTAEVPPSLALPNAAGAAAARDEASSAPPPTATSAGEAHADER
jgi:acetyl-CoA carboxylase carboxyl transferase subunit beta